jgi:hypothetical protein
MLISFVVRLVREDLNAGSVAGEVHNVATGDAAVVRSVDDLIAAFVRGASQPRPAPNFRGDKTHEPLT